MTTYDDATCFDDQLGEYETEYARFVGELEETRQLDALTPSALLDLIVPDDAVCPDCHGSGYVDYSAFEYGRCPTCR